MASYGVFLAACGYEYHGPKGHLAFAPRLTPDDFRAAFTAAEGWGTYSQKRTGESLDARVAVKWGRLKLKSLRAGPGSDRRPENVNVSVAGKLLQGASARLMGEDDRIVIIFPHELTIEAGQELAIELR